MTPAEEARIGREQSPQLIAAFGGVYKDAALADYVNGVGQSLARGGERRDLAFTFTVLDSPIVNAMTLPDGNVFITRGLLALAGNEAELAGVLGHEIGHITARHHARSQSLEILTGVGLTILQAVIGPAVAQGVQPLTEVLLSGYSRSEEYEADELAVRYLTRAGYDTSAMAAFLEKLDAWTSLQEKILGRPSSDRVDYLSSHPNTPDRVREAIAAAQTAPPAKPLVGTGAYLNRLDGVLFGDALARGLIRGHQFILPAERIRFSVPPGYELINTLIGVFALGPAGAQILFDNANVPARLTMVEYIRHGAEKLRLGAVRALDINGLSAATAWGRRANSHGPRDLRIAAIRVDAAHVYRFFIIMPAGTMGAEMSPEERLTLWSFHPITPAEAAALKPLSVRVITVRAGQTQRDFAIQMIFETYRLERFQVLNGLAPASPLKPGQRVKIITD